MEVKITNTEKKFLLNTSWILFERVVQIISQLLVGLISVRYLGPENYGTISYVGSFIGVFNSITTLGLHGVVVKRIIDEPNNVGEIIGTSIIMRVVSSVLSIISILILIAAVNPGENLIFILGILQSLSLVFMSFEVIEFWFQSQLNSKFVSIAKTSATLIVSVWKVYLLITSKSVMYFAFSTTLQTIVTAILLSYLYLKQHGDRLSFSLNKARQLLGESYHFILSGLMVVIYTQIDKIMIAQMLNTKQVGVYTAACSIPSMYSFIFLAVINSARPVILEERNISYDTYLKRIKQLYAIIIWISIIIGIGMTFMAPITIRVLYGTEYISGTQVLRIATWSNLFAVLGTARGIWIVAENKNKYVKKYLAWGAIVNVVLNRLLIPIYGIQGAAIATLITQIVTCVIAPLFYKDTRIHTKYICEASILKWK